MLKVPAILVQGHQQVGQARAKVGCVQRHQAMDIAQGKVVPALELIRTGVEPGQQTAHAVTDDISLSGGVVLIANFLQSLVYETLNPREVGGEAGGILSLIVCLFGVIELITATALWRPEG